MQSRTLMTVFNYHKEFSELQSNIHHLASQVVDNCTLIDITGPVDDTEDEVYNYARVLCHDGSLVLEFRDALSEGDGERIFHCWRFLLPYFKASGKTNTHWKHFDFSCKLKLFCLQCLPTKSFGTDLSIPVGVLETTLQVTYTMSM